MSAAIRTCPAPDCPLCARSAPLLHERLHDDQFGVPGDWSLRRCRSCRLIWIDPRPLAEDIPALYRRYHTHAEDSTSPSILLAIQELLAARILPVTLGYPVPGGRTLSGLLFSGIPPLRDLAEASVLWIAARPGGRLLDVGCGSGALLRRMRDRGWIVSGLEPDPAAAKRARERHGVDVLEGTIETLDPARGCFDVVTLSHVLEHAEDPVALLAKARTLLSPGGRIVVLTPNAESLGRRLLGRAWRGWEVPRHLQLYSRASLAETARRAGLRVLRLRCPSRSAAWMWVESRGGFADRRLLVSGAVFHAAETLLSWISRDAGEELLLVAAS